MKPRLLTPYTAPEMVPLLVSVPMVPLGLLAVPFTIAPLAPEIVPPALLVRLSIEPRFCTP